MDSTSVLITCYLKFFPTYGAIENASVPFCVLLRPVKTGRKPSCFSRHLTIWFFQTLIEGATPADLTHRNAWTMSCIQLFSTMFVTHFIPLFPFPLGQRAWQLLKLTTCQKQRLPNTSPRMLSSHFTLVAAPGQACGFRRLVSTHPRGEVPVLPSFSTKSLFAPPSTHICFTEKALPSQTLNSKPQSHFSFFHISCVRDVGSGNTPLSISLAGRQLFPAAGGLLVSL